MTRRRDRCVVLAQLGARGYPGATTGRELSVLEYVTEHRYRWTSLAADEDSALALVEAHLVDVVVVFMEDNTLRALKAAVLEQGGRLEALHVRRYAPPSAKAQQIIAAHDRGVDPNTIAIVLNIDVERVLAAIGDRTTPADDRRPLLRDPDEPAAEQRPARRPVVDHQQPADHPWRADWSTTVEQRPTRRSAR